MKHTGAEVFDQFDIRLTVQVRTCTPGDLPGLEWFGQFSPHRPLFSSMMERQKRGESLMLVAEVNGTVCGQAWIDLDRPGPDPAAFVWAVRVFPCLQNLGIGTRLFAVCERIALMRGFGRVEISVETGNTHAINLYRRLNYRVVDKRLVHHRHAQNSLGGDPQAGEQWIMRKDLDGSV
jgi:ribosomal protein S18 acetylase RimI-like enzyme